jgi:hypothetical protein
LDLRLCLFLYTHHLLLHLRARNPPDRRPRHPGAPSAPSVPYGPSARGVDPSFLGAASSSQGVACRDA